MATNLPPTQSSDSADPTKLFFDTYGLSPVQFPASEVSATINFFESRGFEDQAAIVTGITILKQAKVEGIPVYEILDKIRDLNETQISALITKILNGQRVPTSALGYTAKVPATSRLRNVAP